MILSHLLWSICSINISSLHKFFHILPIFKLFIWLSIEYKGSLYILDTNHWLVAWFENISFILWVVSRLPWWCLKKKTFHDNKVQFMYFSLLLHCFFMSYLRNHCLIKVHTGNRMELSQPGKGYLCKFNS